MGEPKEFVSLLLKREFMGVAPLQVLPAMYAPRGSPTHCEEAARNLEYVLRHFPSLVGRSPDGEAGIGERPKNSSQFDGDLIMSGVAEAGEDGLPLPTGRSW